MPPMVAATLLVYLVALLGIGIWARGRVEDTGDFHLAGRRLGPVVAALSASASSSSVWTLMGVSGAAYLWGLPAAWLLPAVSGSFLLLVLGLYEPVLRAFNAGEWLVPGVLALGCLVGLLAFSRLLHWLLGRIREPLLAGLTGFMAGSLYRLWPWRADGGVVAPAAYEAATGQPAMLLATLGAAALGVAALWLLSRLE